MGYAVREFVTTPNPNAVKCVLDASPSPEGARPFADAEAAKDNPVAAALFAVPGVRSLLLHDGWLTVVKDPSAPWPAIRTGITKALASVPGTP